MRSSVIKRLMVRGSQVALKHVIHNMVTRTLVMELRWRAFNRWVPCGDMDRKLKIPHPAKVECGFRTTPEECLYDSGLIGLQYRVSQYNTMQCNAMQCNAMPCNAMPCHAMPCHAMPCHAMPCHAMPCHTIQYNTIQYNTIQYNTIQYNTIQYNTIQYNTIQYNTIQYNTYRRISIIIL